MAKPDDTSKQILARLDEHNRRVDRMQSQLDKHPADHDGTLVGPPRRISAKCRDRH